MMNNEKPTDIETAIIMQELQVWKLVWGRANGPRGAASIAANSFDNAVRISIEHIRAAQPAWIASTEDILSLVKTAEIVYLATPHQDERA